MEHEIAANEVGELLRGRMGLIVGPSITCYPGILNDLSAHLVEQGKLSVEGTFLEVADALLDNGISDSQILEWIQSFIGKQKQSAVISHLAKARWASVLSGSLDSHLEDALQIESSRRPTRQYVTVLNDPLTPPPPRTIPVFKLLGTSARDSFAFSTVTYLQRRSTWRHAVRGFADLVKGNPVLCVGMEDCPWLLLDLAGELLGEKTAAPKALLFLASDPLCCSPKIRQMFRQRVRLVTVRGTIGEVARATAAASKAGFAPSLSFLINEEDPYERLRQFDDLVAIVNDHLRARLGQGETNQLLDLLFAPTVPRWDPYVYDLDFRRSIVSKLLPELHAALAETDQNGAACVLNGGAVTGKTVILKRLAWELAKKGELVLWLKPWSSMDNSRALRELFKEVASLKEHQGRSVVVVMDDPLSFGSMSPREVAVAARSADVSILFLTALRTSDWSTFDRADLVGSLPVIVQESLLDTFDDAEWQQLPDYLVKLGLYSDVDSACNALAGVKGHSAQDVLSMLYYLLPQTRVAIASSIREEYFRLGDVAGFTKAVVRASQTGSDILKRAYEMVAVSEHYRGQIPIEVLVSALGVDYGEWVDATGQNSAAWGLLYSEESEDSQTIWYRTRNAIVTRLIVQALNGGSLGHSGELRVLQGLLAACTGRSSSIYREFCVCVLVPHEKLDHLQFEEGLQLYDSALAALPHADRTLLHHKGLWIKNKGGDAAAAKQVLEKALASPDYPYTKRGEADEHIHTSLANTVLDAVNQGSVSLDDGKREMLKHIAKARSTSFFNPHSVHVQAKLISRLAKKIPSDQTPDYFALVNQALEDIDHTLLVLHNHAIRSQHAVGDIKRLESIRDEIIVKVLSVDDLKKRAEEIWTQFQSQEGFILAARKLYAIAQEKNKKFDVAFAYCQRGIVLVEEAGAVPAPGLLATSIQVYYRWRVRRQVMSGTNIIDWSFIRDQSSSLLRSPKYSDDALHKYFYALALGHLGEWGNANAVFGQIRQMGLPNHILWTPRDLLLNETGGIRTIQGVMRSGGNREYLFVEELDTDFHCVRNGAWPKEGEIAHATIQFSFAGATALDRW